uniref:Uncharacterized protein n=1 Tax=Anguilla anguilla TaxID=7936 RepID=A0A0E9SXF7_ANGAN
MQRIYNKVLNMTTLFKIMLIFLITFGPLKWGSAYKKACNVYLYEYLYLNTRKDRADAIRCLYFKKQITPTSQPSSFHDFLNS